jgi:hypothetical protein
MSNNYCGNLFPLNGINALIVGSAELASRVRLRWHNQKNLARGQGGDRLNVGGAIRNTFCPDAHLALYLD